VRLRLVAEVIGQLGCGFDDGLQFRILGVEDAQRVGVQPALAVLVELVLVLLRDS
jgi:hypothetical protein